MTGSQAISRDESRRAADEQAAQRRVAVLAARGVSPGALFAAVAAETGGALGARTAVVLRFEQDGTATVAGLWCQPGTDELALTLGSRWPAEDDSLAGQLPPAGERRQTGCDRAVGLVPDWFREHGIRSSARSPIVVGGRLWGAIIALSDTSADMSDAAELLLPFAELAAMAIASTKSRAELAASRARVVAAADDTRRRIERDLHGTQQRLISLALELRATESLVPPEQRSLREQWSRTAQGLTDVVEQLREISRSLHPVTLEKSGLGPALRALTRRAGVPVQLTSSVRGRLPQRVEVAAYYVVSEALANAATHARASAVEVDADVVGENLRLQIHDDGVGGADAARGSGLTALTDRVEAADGKIEISSPAGSGTTVLVAIPLSSS
jgi:signal transduction histidine kinase